MSILRFAVLCGSILFASAWALPAAAASADRPNVVVILADDLGIGDLKVYNAEAKTRTPNMDRLASQGMRFNDAHTPSSVCTPTRYGLLTGRYCWRTKLKSGVLGGTSAALIEPGRLTLASMLKEAGYATAGYGKWHLGLGTNGKTDYSKPFDAGPVTVGFDHYFGIPASLDMDPYVWIVDDHAEKEPTEKIGSSEHRRKGGTGFWRGGGIAPGFRHVDVLPRLEQLVTADVAERGQAKKPFFLYVPLTAPHTPWVPSPEFEHKSAVGYYGDFVEQVDSTVGKILKSLDDAGLSDNTLVFFTSDNGSHWPEEDIKQWDHRANYIYRGMKSDIHDGGHHVPFVVRWPGKVKPGSSCDQTICLTDVVATVADVLGVKLPKDAAEDSFSLYPLLSDPSKAARQSIIHHSGGGMFAIRSGDWKLVEGLGSGGFTNPKTIKPKPGGPTGQLYNMKTDVSEKQDVFLDHPEIVEKLTKQLDEIRKSGRSR